MSWDSKKGMTRRKKNYIHRGAHTKKSTNSKQRPGSECQCNILGKAQYGDTTVILVNKHVWPIKKRTNSTRGW